MTIPKIFTVALFGLLSFTAQAQNVSSISTYSGPSLTLSPPKKITSSTVISSACDFPVTLTQSTSQTITSGNSAACLENLTYHHDNSYWRVFTLSRALNVNSVEIGIEQAAATSGSQPLTVNIYANINGDFPAGTRIPFGTSTVDVSDQALTKLTIPITASLPRNVQMVLEVFTPSGVASENLFFMGSNSSGQSGSSYISAADCSLPTPVTFSSIGFPNVHLVMNVIGCEGPDIYVDAGAGSGGDGTSWNNAYNSLQDAMDAANTEDEIWVASGTYKLTKDHTGITSPTDPRDKNFHLAKDLKIYGGFFGNEKLFSDRNTKVHETILSGDFSGDDVVAGTGYSLTITNNDENAYHVLILVNLTTASVIDGFTIKGGNADGDYPTSPDGTGSTYITYTAHKFWRYQGGSVYQSNIDARFSNLTISGNWAHQGAGMYNTLSSSKIINTTFKLNSTRVNGGGLYLTNNSSPEISNTIFLGNRAGQSGGAIYNSKSSATIVNSTFVGNSIKAIMDWNTSTTLTISNCIFWENSVDITSVYGTAIVSNCMTQSYTAGTNLIIGQNPVFKDSANGDFQITPCSPAVNTGNNALWNATGLSGDYEGNIRPFGGTVDIGAFECQALPFLTASAIYVKWNAGGNNDGTSWANAFNNLQDALDNQCGGLDIWIAAGTYVPSKDALDNSDPTNARRKTFHLQKDMKIYAGFAGDETQLTERNWQTNETILSGDFNGDDVVSGEGSTLSITNNTENAYHVLITANLTNDAIIDGFMIKGGNASSTGFTFFASEEFDLDEGAGMFNYGSSPKILNVIFTGNTANGIGGGMVNRSSSPKVTNTTFFANSANSGGGMFNSVSSPVITNVTFSGNAASYSAGGGGMYNQLGSAPVITNSIFWNNTQGGNNDTYGADIYTVGSSPSITYSLTQENSLYSSGTGIINNQNPQFVDAANGDLMLSRCSSAINAGDDVAWTTTELSTDLAGNPRPFGTSAVDMGAYEFQGNNQFTNAIYVKHNANGDNDGSTWANAYTDLQDAMDNECGSLPIWVAAGTYLPKDAPDGTTSTGFTDRNNAFHLATDMKIYGGFKGTETLFSERDWKANLTNLSGDFNGDDIVSGSGATLSITNNTENAYHIMITANLTSAAIIDGFNMRAGNAVGTGNIVFSTRTFSSSFGGGLYNFLSSPNILNVTFQGNTAYFGGGLYNSSSNPSISHTTFHGNLVSNSGGGLYNSFSSSIISNTIFEGNSAYYGGGLYNFTFSHSISNSTFKGNSAFAGGGVFNDNSDQSIINSIFWENSGSAGNSFYINNNSSLTISHSLIPEADSTALSNNSNGGISSINNMVYNQNPQFVDAANGFLQLKCNSPAINAGTATGAPTDDITGFIRVGLPDMGAYEYGHAEVVNAIPNGKNPSISGTPILKASSQILNTNIVLYQGSNNVQLLPGFSVAPTGGAATVFRAEIGGGCP
jgi:hypothetical protein